MSNAATTAPALSTLTAPACSDPGFNWFEDIADAHEESGYEHVKAIKWADNEIDSTHFYVGRPVFEGCLAFAMGDVYGLKETVITREEAIALRDALNRAIEQG